MKLQSAMEYLMTYGWAIIVISLAIVIIFELVNVSALPVQECIFPAGFSCLNYFLAQNGLVTINLLQTTQYPINVIAVGCNSPASTANMIYTNPGAQSIGNAIPVSSNFTFSVLCYTNNIQAAGSPGAIYTGWVVVNYTQAYTNINQIIFGKITAKYI